MRKAHTWFGVPAFDDLDRKRNGLPSIYPAFTFTLLRRLLSVVKRG